MTKQYRVTVTLNTRKKIAHKTHTKEKPVTEAELELLKKELNVFSMKTKIPVSIKTEIWVD